VRGYSEVSLPAFPSFLPTFVSFHLVVRAFFTLQLLVYLERTMEKQVFCTKEERGERQGESLGP